jgi:hypothetical protein
MLLYLPPVSDASTQIKHDLKIINYVSSTRLFSFSLFGEESVLNIADLSNYSNATQLSIMQNKIIDNSTRPDVVEENFDVFSKPSYDKKFKTKARIKKVTDFIPKISID